MAGPQLRRPTPCARSGPAQREHHRVTGDFRLGDVRHVFASTALAAAELGFTASEDFDEGMREFAAAPQRGRSTV